MFPLIRQVVQLPVNMSEGTTVALVFLILNTCKNGENTDGGDANY